MDEPTQPLPVQPPPMRPRRRPFRFARTLTVRAILITCAAALISVLVTTAVAFPLGVQAVNNQARRALVDKAALLAELSRQPATNQQSIISQLHNEGIETYVIRAGEPDRSGLPQRVVRQVAAGLPVDGQAVVDGTPVIVAGRPIRPVRQGTRGNGVVLTQKRVTASPRAVLQDLWLALVAGLAAGAISGALLARRLVRPIRSAAHAATRLSAGDRGVRLPEDPLEEAAELAAAVNGLAAALATSEGRQRDFLLSVSHELRTPLTSIKGYAEALADGVVAADGAQRAGRTMLDEAERLDRLIADLLVLARLEAADLPIELMPVDLSQLITAAAQAWAPRCTAVGVDLRTEVPDAPVLAHTDPGRVRQIVDGLCENALRAVPPGAPLVLAVRPDRLAVVEVRDGGPGFTDDDLAVAFERGALSQRYRGIRSVGSGLGLALAARLVRRLGGTIEAGHAPEGGARFTVGLPYQARTSH